MEEVFNWCVKIFVKNLCTLCYSKKVAYTLPLIRAPIHPVVTDTRLHWLWPPPKQMQQISKPPFSINQPASNWNISIIPSSTSLHKFFFFFFHKNDFLDSRKW
jgi:hypothetical protein